MTDPLEEILTPASTISHPHQASATLALVIITIPAVDRGLVEIPDLARLALLHLLIIRPLEALLRTTITEEVAPAVVCKDRALTATEQQTTTIIHPPIELGTTMKERETASTWIKETIRTEDTRQQTHPLATTNHVRVDIIAK
jgi:hypothetical protein